MGYKEGIIYKSKEDDGVLKVGVVGLGELDFGYVFYLVHE